MKMAAANGHAILFENLSALKDLCDKCARAAAHGLLCGAAGRWWVKDSVWGMKANVLDQHAPNIAPLCAEAAAYAIY